MNRTQAAQFEQYVLAPLSRREEVPLNIALAIFPRIQGGQRAGEALKQHVKRWVDKHPSDPKARILVSVHLALDGSRPATPAKGAAYLPGAKRPASVVRVAAEDWQRDGVYLAALNRKEATATLSVRRLMEVNPGYAERLMAGVPRLAAAVESARLIRSGT